MQGEDWVSGCKTVKSNKHCVNKEAFQEEKRKRLGEEFKQLGNDCFRSEEYGRAEAYYTSAILQNDQNHVYFTNRAQVRIKSEDWDGAVEDCKAAIKLKVDSVKAQVTAGG